MVQKMTRKSFDDIRMASRGRWLEVLTEIIGPEFVTGKNGPCPACGGNDCYQFNLRSEVGAFSCRKHERGGGDGFALIQHVLGCDFKTAARHVAQALGLADGGGEYRSITRPATPPPAPAADWLKAKEKAARVWHEGKPVTIANPAGMYLHRRGLLIPAEADSLRFHPALSYWKQGDDGQPEFIGSPPALIARIQRPDGMGAGLHRIYLEQDGRKFSVDGLPSKKLMKAGELSGAAVRLGKPDGDRLAIAEGIETALAFTRLTGCPCWAALSASLMPSAWIPEGVGRVYIAADNDPAGERAAQRLAARLANDGLAAWIIRPEHGNDWNDDLLHHLHTAQGEGNAA